MKRALLLTCILLLGFGSCKKDPVEQQPIPGSEYYPLSMGRFVEYDVDSIVYTELPKDTLTYKYRIKEKLIEEFTDNQGNKSVRLERYYKTYSDQTPYDSMAWKVKEDWLLKPDQQKIVLQEHNISYTKLIFPVMLNASWDGHAYNNLGKTLYDYEYLDKAETLGSIILNRVLKVNEFCDTTNLIIYKLEYEKYAAGVGLVYREIQHLESNTVTPGVPVRNRIEKGIKYKLSIVRYGTE